jgi:hypothetical protein
LVAGQALDGRSEARHDLVAALAQEDLMDQTTAREIGESGSGRKGDIRD